MLLFSQKSVYMLLHAFGSSIYVIKVKYNKLYYIPINDRYTIRANKYNRPIKIPYHASFVCNGNKIPYHPPTLCNQKHASCDVTLMLFLDFSVHLSVNQLFLDKDY